MEDKDLGQHINKNIEQNANSIINIEKVNNLYTHGSVDTDNTCLKASHTDISRTSRTKEKYIGQNCESVYLLDDYADNKEFQYRPRKLLKKSLIFITLSCEGEYFVFLTNDIRNTEVFNSQVTITGRITSDFPRLTVPQIVKEINTDEYSTLRLGDIRKLYEYEEAEIHTDFFEKENIVGSLLANIGFRNKFYIPSFSFELDEGRTYMEYRHIEITPFKSYMPTLVYDCNKIKEFFLKDIQNVDIRKFLDIECVGPQYFFPLSSIHSYHAKEFLCFRNMVISDNVADVLINHTKKLIANAISVDRSNLSYVFEDEILFAIEIKGANNTDNRGKEIEKVFKKMLVISYTERYIISGYRMIAHLYDGDLITDFIYALYKQLSVPVCLACTVLKGNFEYGKMAGLYSTQAGFGGQDYNKFLSLTEKTHEVLKEIDCNGVLLGFGLENKDEFFSGYGNSYEAHDEHNMLFRFKTDCELSKQKTEYDMFIHDELEHLNSHTSSNPNG